MDKIGSKIKVSKEDLRVLLEKLKGQPTKTSSGFSKDTLGRIKSAINQVERMLASNPYREELKFVEVEVNQLEFCKTMAEKKPVKTDGPTYSSRRPFHW